MGEAELTRVIRTTLLRRGDGARTPIRIITQFWSTDGDLLAEVDPLPDERREEIQMEVSVRMGMGAAEAETIAQLLMRLPDDVRDRVVDQLWLRSVFIEQRRRTTLAERDAFDVRADRLLAALDPSDSGGTS